jgi:hypothetical protein
MLPNFELHDKGMFQSDIEQLGLKTFHELIQYVQHLPYRRTSNRSDLTLVFKEQCGTCSSKHGVLQALCELNHIQEVELIVGVFLMNETYHPKIENVLKEHNLDAIPEAHCFLRYQGIRYDFTTSKSDLATFEPYLVREQRCESQQVIDWKPMIHKNFMEGWLKRKKLPLEVEELWNIREKCILVMSSKTA